MKFREVKGYNFWKLFFPLCSRTQNTIIKKEKQFVENTKSVVKNYSHEVFENMN